MDLGELGAGRARGPDPIDFVPRSFVTKHDEGWIGRRELQMIQPVSRGVDVLDLSRRDVDRKDGALQALLEHLSNSQAARLMIGDGLAVRTDLRPLRCVAYLDLFAIDPGAEQQRFVGIYRSQVAARDLRDLAR